MTPAWPDNRYASDPMYRLVISYEGWDVYKSCSQFATGVIIVKGPNIMAASYALATMERYASVMTKHNRFAVILAAIKLQGM